MEFIKESKEEFPHGYYLPTYEECVEMCNVNDEGVFYEVKTEVDGYPISMFNYRFATFNSFINPIPEKPNVKAFEMRGLTFVFNKDGSLFKRYLLLDKFFNLNQTPDSMYSVVKDYKVLNVMNKEDGSLASFIPLPNGKIVGRSKMSFISDQAIEIQRIYGEDKTVQEFIKFCVDRDIVPIFEYVSPTNRIVVPYANTQLILLRIRDNKTGKYLDVNQFSDKLDSMSVCNFEKEHVLDNLVTAADITEGKEGWIVQFENGKMIKVKTKWYFDRHHLFTTEINRENTLIKLIVDEEIDDIMSQLDEPTKSAEIEQVIHLVSRYVNKMSHDIDEFYKKYSEYPINGDRKTFALHYRRHPLFPFVMGMVDGRDKITMIKRHVKSETSQLKQAQRWMERAKETFGQTENTL